MTSKPVAQLLVDLGGARSHSRPHVSNDNPYTESLLKTCKYCPAVPGRFRSNRDARSFCAVFFDHYNHVPHHERIKLHTQHRSTTALLTRSAPNAP